jgi:Holliday junction resolvase RusA-like endonuclease
MHWAEKRQIRQGYQYELFTRFMATKEDWSEATTKMNMRIIIYRPRLHDEDNMVGSCKPLIDAMRDCHFIKQDSPKWLHLIVEQIKERRNPRVEIEIEEAK